MESSEIIGQAWRFAVACHEDIGQTMPGSSRSYLAHVGAVALEVFAAAAREPGVDYELAAVCAILHDVVEDAADIEDATRKSRVILERFGNKAAAGIFALTKDKSLPDKKARMADSLFRLQQCSREARMVKLADRVVNLRPPLPRHWDLEKSLAYLREAGDILDALGPASEHLRARLLRQMEAYEQFVRSYFTAPRASPNTDPDVALDNAPRKSPDE